MKRFVGVAAAAVMSIGILTACADSDELSGSGSDGGSAESSGEDSADDPDDAGTDEDSDDSESDSDSGGDLGSYCANLEQALDEFESLDEGDFAEFDEAIEAFRDLADEAPSEVATQWQTLVGAIDDLAAALEEAGVSFEDLGALESGELPPGVDQEALFEALESIEGLDSAELNQAGDDIEAHGESECGVTFP